MDSGCDVHFASLLDTQRRWHGRHVCESHLIKYGSAVQSTIALSSGESEYPRCAGQVMHLECKQCGTIGISK